VLSLVSFGDIFETPTVISAEAESAFRIRTGSIAVIIMAISLAAIPAFAFPVLRCVNEALALTYLVLRGAIEMTVYLLMACLWLLMTVPAMIEIPALRRVFADQDAVLNPVLTLVFCLGAAVFYYVLFKGRLVPRWIVWWGFFGLPLYVASAPLILFERIDAFSIEPDVLNLPIALQDMVLAAYLICFGFRPLVDEDG